MQKLEDSFQKMDAYMEGYRQFIDHFKKAFPYVFTQIFNEGEINMRTTNDTSDQGGNQSGRDRIPLFFLENWKKVTGFWENMS